ncbi:DUF1840 domain-containing protein [Undibacterium sp. Ren11W]|uniref:DUF1840 domain-containing protein n=1 Tax=Undibacterium sp. Ren11W TaxID=3413045 RepID=UPI003BF41EAC
MLITFTSKAAAEVTMYKEHARRALELLHKNVDRGVLTFAETANAIKVIEEAVAESRAHPISEEVLHDIEAHPDDDDNEHEHEAATKVSFSARMFPLLDMLRAAHKNKHDVIWSE